MKIKFVRKVRKYHKEICYFCILNKKLMIDHKRGFLKALLDAVNPYGWVTGIRNKAFDCNILKSRSFDIPVICIGNITVGGTGKTPHTEYLVRLLRRKYRTAVLSRGYGRDSKGYVKAGTTTTMTEIGDEPFQIKNKFKEIDVAVCEKRVEGIKELLGEKNGLQVILLDDAFQHRYVKAGLNILLIDSNRPLWQDCILPFGRMRESIRGIKRADVAVITKCKGITPSQAEWCKRYLKREKDIPVFFSTMRYGEHYPLFADNRKTPEIRQDTEVLLVTGIAKPEPLKSEIESRGARVKLMQYADHHNFTVAELGKIAESFNRLQGKHKMIMTTEKDATRLLQRKELPDCIKENIYALPIEIDILYGDEKMFNQIIEDYVTENSRNG